jgi:succinate dehydrogenase/fumarate reductase flavoprotein subunit
VLIVGAGPAGLALAASLRQLGVDCVLIDRNDAVQPGSKAAAGLRWTLALPGQPRQADEPGEHGELAVRHVPGLDEPLLVRPDGYLAAHGVETAPQAVLDRLPHYLPRCPAR